MAWRDSITPRTIIATQETVGKKLELHHFDDGVVRFRLISWIDWFFDKDRRNAIELPVGSKLTIVEVDGDKKHYICGISLVCTELGLNLDGRTKPFIPEAKIIFRLDSVPAVE